MRDGHRRYGGVGRKTRWSRVDNVLSDMKSVIFVRIC